MPHSVFNYDWDWPTAEREFKRALELNPQYATAYHWHSDLLAVMGRMDESLAEEKRAQELDPLSLIINTWVGWRLFFMGRYDEAIDQYHRTLALDSTFLPAHWQLGLAYEQKKLADRAIAEFETCVSSSGRSALYVASLAHAYAVAGKKAETEKLLDELIERSKQQYVSSYQLALIYIGLGEKERAFQQLENAYTEHSGSMVYLNRDPRLQALRSDPRFRDLMRRIGGFPGPLAVRWAAPRTTLSLLAHGRRLPSPGRRDNRRRDRARGALSALVTCTLVAYTTLQAAEFTLVWKSHLRRIGCVVGFT